MDVFSACNFAFGIFKAACCMSMMRFETFNTSVLALLCWAVGVLAKTEGSSCFFPAYLSSHLSTVLRLLSTYLVFSPNLSASN